MFADLTLRRLMVPRVQDYVRRIQEPFSFYPLPNAKGPSGRTSYPARTG